MTTPNPLIELAERCEKLTGPCRETDGLIYRSIDPVIEECWKFWSPAQRETIVPHYTASLDAALTLVPERHGFYFRRNCSADGDVVYCNAQVWPFSNPRDDEAPRYWANSPEDAPALALVAACLKARAASESPHG